MWRVNGFSQQKKAFEVLVNQGLVHAFIFKGLDQIGKKMFATGPFRAGE
jgi:hypothetical protein